MSEWLLRDPLASWRRIIDELYKMELLDAKYRTLGDSILHYAEELTGMYMTLNHMIHTSSNFLQWVYTTILY